MDARQFDALTKALGSGASRRRVLGVLAGSVVAAFGRQASLAHHKPEHCAKAGQKPTPGKGCCAGLTEDVDGRCGGVGSPPQSTQGGPCKPNGRACKSGLDCCGGACADSPGKGPAKTCQTGPCAGGDFCNPTPGCNSNSNCFCASTASGAGFCALNGASCAECTAGSGCPEGQICIQSPCCNIGSGGVTTACVVPCPAPD